MATASADRNLLFGVLAVQLDFVSRDDLVTATSLWVLDKNQPLSDVFVAQGMISAEEAQLIENVVAKHLERNNDDPRQSLQSIEAFEEVRATLGDLEDEDLRSTVEFDTLPMGQGSSVQGSSAKGNRSKRSSAKNSAAKGDAEHIDPFSTQAVGSPDTIDAQHRFTILRLHQKGGLGRVSIAMDQELHREIALKEILSAHADNVENRTRFIREAEITGALEHPGVVPVYSLGQFADGRPYYAMRFIRGMNMQVAIEDYHNVEMDKATKQLEFRNLLSRFIDVCNALEYAHSRGVIHRDLKPGNIMLGDYGETLVVDWGLAKTLAEGFDTQDTMVAPVTTTDLASSTATMAGRVVGTPAYMSPEQAAGRLDALGPRSDIYSLGATLYHLLVGKVAFKGTEDEVLGNVQMGRFTKPREANPAAPRAMEAICLKAMARLPEERYESGRELAADIERYLAGERVLAYAEPLTARAWRWVRNHQPVVYSTAAALAVILTALTISVVTLSAANTRVRASRDQARRSFEEADRQRERAERNFTLARDAVRDYYVSVSEETLLKQPGLQPLRESLLRQALVYYQSFLDERQDDPNLREEVAQAQFFTGQITQAIDSPANALTHYQRASEIQKELHTSSPDSTELAAAYGKTLNALGDASIRLGQLDDAADYFQQAIDVRDQLATADPDDTEAARTLASSVMNLGFTHYQNRNYGAALERAQHAQTIRLAHASDPDNVPKTLQRDLGMGYYILALIHTALKDMPQAQANYVSAIDAFERLLELDPDDMSNRRRLAACHRMVGEMESNAGNSAAAIDYYQRAQSTMTTLKLRNPDVLEYASDLAGVEAHLGLEQAKQEQTDEAITSLESSIALLSDLLTQAGDVPRFQLDLGVYSRELGKVLAAAKRGDDALASLDQSRTVLSQLVKADPTNEQYTSELQITNDEIARVKALALDE